MHCVILYILKMLVLDTRHRFVKRDCVVGVPVKDVFPAHQKELYEKEVMQSHCNLSISSLQILLQTIAADSIDERANWACHAETEPFSKSGNRRELRTWFEPITRRLVDVK